MGPGNESNWGLPRLWIDSVTRIKYFMVEHGVPFIDPDERYASLAEDPSNKQDEWHFADTAAVRGTLTSAIAACARLAAGFSHIRTSVSRDFDRRP